MPILRSNQVLLSNLQCKQPDTLSLDNLVRSLFARVQGSLRGNNSLKVRSGSPSSRAFNARDLLKRRPHFDYLPNPIPNAANAFGNPSDAVAT